MTVGCGVVTSTRYDLVMVPLTGDPAMPCDPEEPEQRRLDDEPEPSCPDRTVLGDIWRTGR